MKNKKEKQLFGKTEPRIFTPPLRKLTSKTSLGFACIEYAETILKKTLYPWQKWILIHMLEIIGDLEKEWHFRFHTVVILVARQNGKTILSEVIVSFFLNVLQAKRVLGTSLKLDKADETLKAVIADQETIPVLACEIYKVSHANGNNQIELKGNRVYKTAATNDKCGRGDSNDLVILDELREHRNKVAWDAVTNSTNARPNSLIVCFSNAGDVNSIILRQLRSQAIAEIEQDVSKKRDFGFDDVEGLGLFEWSAPDDAEITDIEALLQANPALGQGNLTLRALKARLATSDEISFRTECLCQTVESLLKEPFPRGSWENLLDNNSCIAEQSEIYYGIDMSADRRYVSIAACGRREDGHYHIEVITKRSGTQWAVDWFRERAIKGNMNLAFQGRGAPVCGLAEEICTLQGVTRYAIEGPELSAGWARFYDGIASGQPVPEGETERGGIKIYHLEQPVLDRLAKVMQLKNFGNGTSLPDRVKSPDDISPLFACIMAFSAATQLKQQENKKIYQSVYSDSYTLTFA